MISLRDKTISGVFWSFLQQVGARGVSFIVTIILARLLTPQAFGLIGMLTIFIQISQTVIYAGFSQALIQKKDADEEDYSSVFYINLVVSVILYVVLFFLAPHIANFYDQPILTDLTRVLSLVFVINAFSYVQEARLRKEMDFKTLMLIHIPSTVIGGIISIIMALFHFGVWSIVVFQVVSRLAYAIQLWWYAKWKPLFIFNKTKVKELFSFGSKLMLTGIINAAFDNVYLVVIGKYYSLSSVGYYQNANNLVQYSTSTLSSVLGSVTFPAFSSIQDDNRRLKEGYKKIIQQMLFWLCPVFILAGVMAPPLFKFIFTSKWLPAVPYFRWLCIVGILYPLNVYNLNIVNVKGRTDIVLKLTIVKKIVTIVGVAGSVLYGSINALLAFNALFSVFAYILNTLYSGYFIQYNIKEQLKDILPILLLGVLVGGITFSMDQLVVQLADSWRLFLGFTIGFGLYWGGAKLFKLSPYLDFINIFRSKILTRF